jgi:hypothetical protein
MVSDGYNPTIIGYSHSSPLELPPIEKKLEELRAGSEQPLNVGLEIGPKQPGWIRQFLELEAEFKAHGTIDGETASPDETERMAAHRKKLNHHHGEHVALWCLERGIGVESIEHPEVQQWIRQDVYDDGEDEELGWIDRRAPQPFHVAIKRDIYGLELIEERRPDIISVGYLHGLKYDMLLNRDGQQSFYYLGLPIRWDNIMQYWKDAHAGWQYYGAHL